MEISTFPGEVGFLDADLIVAGIYEDERPPQGLAGQLDWYLFGQLTDLLLAGVYGGKKGEFALLATQGRIRSPRFMLAGLGPKGKLEPQVFREMLGAVVESIRRLRVRAVGLELLGAGEPDLGTEGAAKLLVDSLGSRSGPPPAELVFLIPADEEQQEIIEKLL